MKKILFSTLLLLGGVCAFTSCEDDNDSNPILTQPTEFVLNEPAIAAEVVDLAHSDAIKFSWSQPNYGFPTTAAYYMQVSATGEFTHSIAEAEKDETGATVADYFEGNGVTVCSTELPAADLAKILQQLCQYPEDNLPETQDVYVRFLANIPVSGGAVEPVGAIYSNVVKLTVVPYYVMLQDAPIELWYLIGSCVGDGAWSNDPAALGKSIIPMNIVDGYDYDSATGQGELTFTGYLTTDGFKLIRVPGSWNDQWGQGAAFGEFVKNDGGSGNISVPANGYYTVTLNTKDDVLKVEAAEIAPAVYAGMCMSGDFNGWGDTEMVAVNTVASVAANNHVWSATVTLSDGGLKFKIPGSWDANWGADGFPYGVGVNNGPNIPAVAGTYVVVFNDITGHYHFFVQE